MVITKEVPRYQTKPLECWAKGKELAGTKATGDRFEKAREEGKLTIGYFGEWLRPVFRGFNHECLVAESYAAQIANDEVLGEQCHDAVNNWGYPADICGYARSYWGSMLLNKSPWGAFPKLDVLVHGVGGCATHNKLPQVLKEYLGIPCLLTDGPQGHRRQCDNPEDFEMGKEVFIQNLVDELHEVVEWLEEKSGQRFNEEFFLESLRNQWEHRRLFSEVVLLNQAVPAPLDIRALYSLMAPSIQLGGGKEVADFYHTLYDEVKWRVDNKIAWLATERCRLVEDSIPPWYAMSILRYPNKWGATIVACPYLFGITGCGHDGEHYVIPETFEEMGLNLRTREDGFRFMAEESMTGRGSGGGAKKLADRMEHTIRDWKADGAILRINTGCTGHSATALENIYHIKQRGIPMTTYECNQSDRRTWNEKSAMGKIEAFLEGTLGLTRLEN